MVARESAYEFEFLIWAMKIEWISRYLFIKNKER